jgi:hypothetical protein
MKGSISPCHEPDRVRLWAYALVALAGLIAGLILGLLSSQRSGSSRAGWPPPPTNPRSLNP